MTGRRHPIRTQPDGADIVDRGSCDIGDRLGHGHPTRSRRIDRRQRRPLAHRHGLAGITPKPGRSDGDVTDRHLPGSDQLVAHTQAADRAIADMNQE